MNKAISPGSEFTEIGSDLPVELQYFGDSAAGSKAVAPAPAVNAPVANRRPDPTMPSPNLPIPRPRGCRRKRGPKAFGSISMMALAFSVRTASAPVARPAA